MGRKEEDLKMKPKSIERIKGLKELFGSKISGVYFLCMHGKVVYVGKSENLFSRIGTHTSFKVYDSIFYLEVPASDLIEVESFFIRKIKPQGNCSQRLINGRLCLVSKKHSDSFSDCVDKPDWIVKNFVDTFP